MISKAWGKADTANPSQDLNPEDYGWEKDGDIFRPVWFDGPSLPPSLETNATPNYDDGQKLRKIWRTFKCSQSVVTHQQMKVMKNRLVIERYLQSMIPR